MRGLNGYKRRAETTLKACRRILDAGLDCFRGVPGKAASKPARHFMLLQIVNFLFTLQNEDSYLIGIRS
jgi:hypothetical protein